MSFLFPIRPCRVRNYYAVCHCQIEVPVRCSHGKEREKKKQPQVPTAPFLAPCDPWRRSATKHQLTATPTAAMPHISTRNRPFSYLRRFTLLRGLSLTGTQPAPPAAPMARTCREGLQGRKGRASVSFGCVTLAQPKTIELG
jgi:hypothetical protein